MLYEILKYAKTKNVGLGINFFSESDYVKITAYKTDGVSRYGKTLTLYGIEATNPEPGDIITGQVKEMVDDLIEGKMTDDILLEE